MRKAGDIFVIRMALTVCLGFAGAVDAQNTSQAFLQNQKTLRVYQDADLSRHSESAVAIQQGIEVAFDEIGNQIQGYRIEFRYLDHRGNVVASKKNYHSFLSDPHALAIYSGIHSPPLIKNRTFINESKALTLVPWAAGGPITRHPARENWIFRLSIDDTRAAPKLLDFAIQEKKCKSPRLLLEKSPWGISNLQSMTAYLKLRGLRSPDVENFGWNLNDRNATMLLDAFVSAGNDCIVFVGNPLHGAVFARAMLNLATAKRIPIVSHWGITGGDFHVRVNRHMRRRMDLSFIQSCFAYTDPQAQNDFSLGVFNRLKRLYPDDIREPSDLKAAVGFIHAYDLTRLLIQAINEIQLSGDAPTDRDAIRRKLESLNAPVRGLIKTYQQPFSVFHATNNANAHEALGPEDYCMASYSDRNSIVLLPQSGQKAHHDDAVTSR